MEGLSRYNPLGHCHVVGAAAARDAHQVTRTRALRAGEARRHLCRVRVRVGVGVGVRVRVSVRIRVRARVRARARVIMRSHAGLIVRP